MINILMEEGKDLIEWKRGDGHVRTEAEFTVNQEPRNAWSHKKLEEARKFSPLSLSREHDPANTLISDLSSETVRKQISVLLIY